MTGGFMDDSDLVLEYFPVTLPQNIQSNSGVTVGGERSLVVNAWDHGTRERSVQEGEGGG